MLDASITSSRRAGPALALGSMFSAQLSTAIAVPLVIAHGSFRISALRLACAAAFSLVLARPNVARVDRRQWRAAVALGVVIAFMTSFYYAAIGRVPVGPAAAITLLGPLGVAAVSLKGWARFALPALAAGGVLAMTYGSGGWLIDPIGLVLGLSAALSWACYIILSRHVGRLFSRQDGLCLSFVVAAVATMPAAAALEPSGHWLPLLPAAAVLAILSPLLTFTLEMIALRRIGVGTFSILMSLEPAIGTLLGFAILGQILSVRLAVGVLIVIMASAGAVMTPSLPRRPFRPPAPSHPPCESAARNDPCESTGFDAHRRDSL